MKSETGIQYLQNIRLDISGKSKNIYIDAKQGDNASRFLKITMYSDGYVIKPSAGETAIFRCLKPDGHSCLNSAVINEDGTMTVELTSQVLAVKGLVNADISIMNGESLISTATFFIQVEQAPVSANTAASSDEFLLLIEKVDESIVATNAANDATERAETATEAANTAADRAGTATEAANTAADRAGTATEAANTAAERAEQAASAIFDELTANNTSYDNNISGLNGETVQEAIDELSSSLDSLAGVTLKHITSWAKVQEIVRAGRADKVFNVGDQFTVMKGSTPLVFDVIGIDHDIPTDSTKTHSMTLQLHDCFTSLQFDAPEPTNPNGDRMSSGSNNWLESALRQWLNATGNDWWSAQTEYDAAPSYATTAGFLSDIDNEFLSVIGNVKKITTKNTVTDGGGSVDSDEKIFLLSRSEVYGGDESNINEGEPYPFYSENSSLPSAGAGADLNRIKYLSDVASRWWLRSPMTYNAYQIRATSYGGALTYGRADVDYGVAPACCII